MADVVCLGELLIDFVPTVTGASLIEAPAFKKAPGGAPANVATLHAIAIARCLISCDPNLRLALWPDAEAAGRGLQLAMRSAP
jgi:pfkB family carbohydrate kinase